jgi:hypothetical protein
MDSEGALLSVPARVEGGDGHDFDSGFSAAVETMAQSRAQWISIKMKEKKGFYPGGSPLAADSTR